VKLPVIPFISLILLTSSISLSIAGSCPSVAFIKDEANWVVHEGALVLRNVPEIGTMSTNDDSGSILFIQQNLGNWKQIRIAGSYLQCVYEPNFIFTSNNQGYYFTGNNTSFTYCPNARSSSNASLEVLRTRICTFAGFGY
jgi:hypothetical protein